MAMEGRVSDEIKEKLAARYGKSEAGNYSVCDTIGVPHPYCIGAKHVVHASDHFSGMLGKEAILSAEKKGIKCEVRGCQLSYEQHEQALLVECHAPLKGADDHVTPELHEYLLKCKPLCEEDKYAGFAFLDRMKPSGLLKEGDTSGVRKKTTD